MKDMKAIVIMLSCIFTVLLLSTIVNSALPTAVIREVKPTENLSLALCLDLDKYTLTKNEEIELPMYVRNPLYNTSVKVNYFYIQTNDLEYRFQPSSIDELKPQEVRVVTVTITPKEETEYGSYIILVTADCLFYDMAENAHYPGDVNSAVKIFVVTKYKNLRIILTFIIIFVITLAIILRKRWIALINKKFKKRTFQKTKKKVSQQEIDKYVDKKLKAKKVRKVKKSKK